MPIQAVCLILTLLWGTVAPANILGFFGVPSISHQQVYQAIWKELSLRGHKVTVVTPNPLNDPTLTNLTEIDVGYSYEALRNYSLKKFSRPTSHWDFFDIADAIMVPVTEAQFKHPEVIKLFEDKTKHFDVLLAEPFTLIPSAFSYRFNCPWISVESMDVLSTMHNEIGNPHHPVLHSNCIATFKEDKPFLERIEAVLYHIYFHYRYYYDLIPKIDKYARNFFGKNMPYLGDIHKNVSMMFINVDPIVHRPRAFQSNVIALGGRLHIKQKKPLPQDLKSYLDSSKEGVIYFSLGSNVNGSVIDINKRNIFIETFSELPYKVLWKFEDHMENKPQNVKINKWLPQQDILGHPNVKLFITQAGFQSLEEAIFNKVPMLGIPFLGDQFFNSQRITTLGIGKNLDFATLTKQDLKEAILEIVENPIYKETITKISKIASDEPMTGLEKAVWWTEYVIRNRGAEYLKSNDFDFPWYKFLLLDVLGILFSVLFILLYLLYRIFRYLKQTVLISTKPKKKLA